MGQTKEAEKKQDEQISEKEKALTAELAVIQAENAKMKLEAEAKLEAKTEKEAEEAKAELEEQADMKKFFADATKDENLAKDKTADDLTPTEVLNIISEAFEASSKAQAEQAESKFEAIVKASDEKFNKLATVLHGVVAKSNVDNVKSQHADFEEVKPWMIKVNEKYPGMDTEDMYQMGKSWMGVENAPTNKAASERPGDHMTGSFDINEHLKARESRTTPRGHQRVNAEKEGGKDNKPNIHGIVQWRSIVDAGIGRALSIK